MIFLDDSVENLRLLMVGFPFLLTSILIIASYGIIWWYVRSKGRDWKSYGHCHVKKAVEKRKVKSGLQLKYSGSLPVFIACAVNVDYNFY